MRQFRLPGQPCPDQAGGEMGIVNVEVKVKVKVKVYKWCDDR